jgi:hypothetical protein
VDEDDALLAAYNRMLGRLNEPGAGERRREPPAADPPAGW